MECSPGAGIVPLCLPPQSNEAGTVGMLILKVVNIQKGSLVCKVRVHTQVLFHFTPYKFLTKILLNLYPPTLPTALTKKSPRSYTKRTHQFSHSVVSNSATPWTAACQASLSITNSWSMLKLMSIESVMPSNHLILCHPLLLPSIFPSIRIFSNESVLPPQIAKVLELQLQHQSFLSKKFILFDRDVFNNKVMAILCGYYVVC